MVHLKKSRSGGFAHLLVIVIIVALIIGAFYFYKTQVASEAGTAAAIVGNPVVQGINGIVNPRVLQGFRVNLDPSNPTSRMISVSQNNGVQDATVLVVNAKAGEVEDSTVTSMTVNFASTGTSPSVARLSYSTGPQQSVGFIAQVVGGKAVFTNINLFMAKNTNKTFTVALDYPAGTSNMSSVRATMTQATYTRPNGTSGVVNLNLQGSTHFLSVAGVSVATQNVSIGTCNGGGPNNPDNVCSMTMSFVVTNTGNSSIYISKTPAISLSTKTSVNGLATSVASTSLYSINIPTGPGDTVASYNVQTNSSRTFTYTGVLSRPANGGAEKFQITAIKFGTTATNGVADATMNAQTTTPNTNTANLINSGLEALSVLKVF